MRHWSGWTFVRLQMAAFSSPMLFSSRLSESTRNCPERVFTLQRNTRKRFEDKRVNFKTSKLTAVAAFCLPFGLVKSGGDKNWQRWNIRRW